MFFFVSQGQHSRKIPTKSRDNPGYAPPKQIKQNKHNSIYLFGGVFFFSPDVEPIFFWPEFWPEIQAIFPETDQTIFDKKIELLKIIILTIFSCIKMFLCSIHVFFLFCQGEYGAAVAIWPGKRSCWRLLLRVHIYKFILKQKTEIFLKRM